MSNSLDSVTTAVHFTNLREGFISQPPMTKSNSLDSVTTQTAFQLHPDRFKLWLSNRVDKLIGFNKKELETNQNDKKLLDIERSYQTILSEVNELKHHQCLFLSKKKVLDLDSKIQPKEKELDQLYPKSLIYLRERFSSIEGADVFLPRYTTDNVDYIQRTMSVSKPMGQLKTVWDMHDILFPQPHTIDPPRTSDLYMERTPEYPQGEDISYNPSLYMEDDEFKQLIHELPMEYTFMGGRIYDNWYHRLRRMYMGLSHIKKCRDNFSTIVRTPQYLRLCYALEIITEQEWRDLTAQEEQTRYYAIDAVPILQDWIADFEGFIEQAKNCGSTDELFEKVKQMDANAALYMNRMERLRTKYFDPTIYDIFTSTFIEYNPFVPYEPNF